MKTTVCTHDSKSLNILPSKCLDSIRCPLGHNTWSYVGNLCYCYNSSCWDTFCGFCQHNVGNCKHNKSNKPTGFWLFALSFQNRRKGKELAEYASPLWENLSDEEKKLWRDRAKNSY